MLVKEITRQFSFPATTFIAKFARALWHRQAGQKFLAEVPLTQSSSVLDIGCGIGRLTKRVASVALTGRVVGVDPCERRIQRAIKRCLGLRNVEFYVGDANLLPWDADSFDYVLCLDSFHEHANPGSVLTEVFRILKPGGKLFLAVREYLKDGNGKAVRGAIRDSRRPLHLPRHYLLSLEHSGFVNVWQKMESEYLLTVGTKS